MENICISYTYVNCANETTEDSIVVSNTMELPLDEVEKILSSVVDFDSFLPAEIGIPPISPIENPYYPVSDTDTDHAWHGDLSLEETNEAPDFPVTDIWSIIKKAKEFDYWREVMLMREVEDDLFDKFLHIRKQREHLESILNEEI